MLGAEPARRLRAALGTDVQLLDGTAVPHALIADADGVSAAELVSAIATGGLGSIDGPFAVAWRSDDAVHLARDPIGHRTLYYALHGGALVFASHLGPLIAAFELPRRLALRAVAAFLAYAYVPGRATLVDGVFEVLPGERVTLRRGELTREMYWHLPHVPPSDAPLDAQRDRLRATLEHVVRSALPAHEPVSASLSGGIDSSLVVALARRLHPHPVRSFSITFGDGYKNELLFSSMVADHVGTEHHVVELPPETIVAHLDDTIACMDKPNGDPLTVPNALLFREMAQYGQAALNGEGGDPCFGGPKNLPMLLAELYGEPGDDDPRTARERSYLRAHLKCYDDLPAMLAPDAFARACDPPLEHDLEPWFADPRHGSLVATLMAINVRFKGGHHILPKVDALAEPFGVIPRSPLFSRRIVELAFTVPPTLLLAGSIEKFLLKQAVRDLLPPAILDRPKSGMLVPVEGWFSGPLQAYARTRLLDGALPRTVFQRGMLESLLAGKKLGLRPRRGVKIWLLITLESHLRALGITA
ncbi:MAG: asparagine synthetase B [Kofleriaceae bacterium]